MPLIGGGPTSPHLSKEKVDWWAVRRTGCPAAGPLPVVLRGDEASERLSDDPAPGCRLQGLATVRAESEQAEQSRAGVLGYSE